MRNKLYLFWLLILLLATGCASSNTKSLPVRLSSSNDFNQLSEALREREDVDLSKVDPLVTRWFSSIEQKSDYFTSGSLPTHGDIPPINAGRFNANNVIKALLFHSLKAASAGDEVRSHKAFSLAIKATQKIIPLYAYEKSRSCSFTNLAAITTLREADKTLSQFPESAKKWSWYKTTRAAVTQSLNQTKPVGDQLVTILSSPSPDGQWDSFCPASSQQVTRSLDLVSDALK